MRNHSGKVWLFIPRSTPPFSRIGSSPIQQNNYASQKSGAFFIWKIREIKGQTFQNDIIVSLREMSRRDTNTYFLVANRWKGLTFNFFHKV